MIEPHPTASDEMQGRVYWQSLQEYADSPALREKIAQEFPDYDPDELLGMSRRKFMKLAGASMALAGLTLTGCRRWPKEKVVAHNARPEGTLPGVPETYASMLQRGGVATGVFVTSFDGRPIHVAGSPLHPICGDPQRYAEGDLQYGSADVFTLASILDLYDPDRSRGVVKRTPDRDGVALSDRSDWDTFFSTMKDIDGKKLAVLSEPNHGPAFQDVKKRFLDKFPGATWATWEPLHRDTEVMGAMTAFDRPVRPQYDTSKAKTLACFDSDFLTDHPAAAKHARGWAQLRRSCDEGSMSRVFAAGPTLNATLSNADVHLQVKPSTIAAMMDALALAVGVKGLSASPGLNDDEAKFVELLAKDLKAHKGESLVVVGPSQPASVHALAWSINAVLGNVGEGKAVAVTEEPAGDEALCVDAIADLVEKMNAGEIDTLLILGGNPVFDAPADLNFAAALGKVENAAHLSLYDNETSAACAWHLPEAHYLECWGDGRAWDGTICLQQPLIEPLFGGKSAIEVLATLAHDDATAGYDLVRRAWSAALKAGQYNAKTSAWAGGNGETAWRAAVHDGLLPDSAYATINTTPGRAAATGVTFTHDEIQIAFRGDSKVYDGRFANNGWLQELPETITKITWDNPAWVSVKDAQEMGLKNGDVIKLTVDGRELDVAATIVPGQAPGVIALTLGQGRTAGGRIAEGVGFNTYAIRTSDSRNNIVSAKVEKTGQTFPLATTSVHHLIDVDRLDEAGTDWVAKYGLDKRIGKKPGSEGMLVKQASLAEYLKNPNFANDDAHGSVSLQLYDAPLAEEFAARAAALKKAAEEKVAAGELDAELVEGWEPADQFNDKHAWGMTIDMTSCIGCNACVIACQSENNIPVVGKDQVMMSREMQWMRVDSYFRGKPDANRNFKLDGEDAKDAKIMDTVHMPVTCIHCENAPCEQVCPVAATVHDTEGLNTMVYNRCIGTRYCSNNCPYKVRRFNYFDYHAKLDSPKFRNTGKPGGLQNNPWLKMPDQQPGDMIDQVRRMVFNPDVTVRMRGVMEKCTYCTQRIQRAKIEAKARWAEAKTAGHDVADYPYVEDGGITTACEGACPTEAITFGNLNDPKAKVAQLQNKNKRSYRLLEELNSRPRTKHMGLVRNPVKA